MSNYAYLGEVYEYEHVSRITSVLKHVMCGGKQVYDDGTVTYVLVCRSDLPEETITRLQNIIGLYYI